MIAGEGLAEWLADPSRQAASLEAAEAFGRRWREHPLVEDLKSRLRQADGASADAVLGAAEAFLDGGEAVLGLVEDTIAAAKGDAFFRPPFRMVATEIHSGLLLVDQPPLSVLLAVTSAEALAHKKVASNGPSSISFSGQHSVFHFLKSGGATLSFWEAPEIDACFTGDSSGLCRLVERRRIEDGERIRLDGRSQSFVMEHARGDIVYLQAVTSAEAAPLAVEYDSRSLALAGASSADEASSRIQMMVTLLRLMDRADAAPVLGELIKSPHFYTRWHVMREWLALDAESALPPLREMASSDPHSEVRSAAAQTLAMFFDKEPASCPA